MITNALSSPLPVAPAPAPSGAPTTSNGGKEAGSGPGPFARLLDDAGPHTGKTSGSRTTSTNKVPAAKERQKERVDKSNTPVDPNAKQAGPTVPPVECPAEVEAAAPEQAEQAAATPGADAAALLASLPPLPLRPYPGGNSGPVRSPAGNSPLPGGTRSPANDIDPVLTPPDLGDTRDTRNAARGSAAVAFAETLREAKASTSETKNPLEQTALPLPAQAPTATAVSASAPAEARIAATPGSADFASQLGAQLSTFVRDGIEHAKLELHPLELGPVTVQIQIDGNSAQVTLAAEQAPTRAALEDALPQLASSLREAGLTLTGGGVFEQPRQPNQADQQPGGRGDGSVRSDPRSERDTAARESVTLQPLAAPRRRGVVDLVA